LEFTKEIMLENKFDFPGITNNERAFYLSIISRNAVFNICSV